MQPRTDFLTTFLSGASLLLIAPFLIMVFVQAWVIVIIALVVTGFAVWSVLLKLKPDESESEVTVSPTSTELAPEIVHVIKETLACPYCSNCGEKYLTTSTSYCSFCGEERSYKPLSELLDIDAD